MPTLFTRIINGEIPGKFIWRDDRAVAFMTIAPIQPGHALIVPVEEVDHWIDASPELRAYLLEVAARIGAAQMEVFRPARVGLIIAGMEVPHLHIHVIPIESERDFNFANADPSATDSELEEAAQKLRAALEGTTRP